MDEQTRLRVAGVIRCSDTGRAALVAVVVVPEQRRSPGSPTPTPDPPNTLFQSDDATASTPAAIVTASDASPAIDPALQAPGEANERQTRIGATVITGDATPNIALRRSGRDQNGLLVGFGWIR